MMNIPRSIVSQFVSAAWLIGLLLTSSTTRSVHGQTESLEQVDTSVAGNEQVAEIIRRFQGRGVMADDSQPTPPDEAVSQFVMRDGFEIELVASEPTISQPLFVSWDSKGRMWVVQYRQYQFPAGLKVVRYDQHLRAVFDKVPAPPPQGTPGVDRITMFTDTDGDGRYDESEDVITGLNIATSVQIGHGGIWVLNPPYLLFYPDADGDGRPDDDPQVALSGFGLQDTHSVANSLLWGPDGWLYAANGSTTTGTIDSEMTKGVSFQGQCIWRYHPDHKVFEIYAEGGGNTFSLDIDKAGHVFAGYNGGGTRGFYFPQGSYFQKNWGKHGPLTNPYAFGFFPPMKFEGDPRRFPQALLVYDGGLFPPEYAGDIIAPNSMLNRVWVSQRYPDGSTFRTVDEPLLLETPDRWFRPVYSGVGPDGAVYVADWYDTRLSHVSPIDDWHKDSGRIYRVYPTGSHPRYAGPDLSTSDPSELVTQLASAQNKWVRQRAALEIGWRKLDALTPQLVELVTAGKLEAVWALSMLNQFTQDRALQWLDHESADIRRWTIRLLGDNAPYLDDDHPQLAYDKLATVAAQDDDILVRSQLASTAKRMPTKYALPIIAALVRRDEDAADPYQPLMLWWALEAHGEDWSQIHEWLGKADLWQHAIFRDTLATRLMQRYAAAGGSENFARCAALIEMAPDVDTRQQFIEGLNRAFQGRTLPKLPDSIAKALDEYRAARGESGLLLALEQGDQEGVQKAIETLSSGDADLGLRIEIARVFGQHTQPAALGPLLSLATGGSSSTPALQRVAIRSLAAYDDPRIGPQLTAAFDNRISAEHDLRVTACRTLVARESGALALLKEINEWRLKPTDVPPDVVQQLRTYQTPEVAAAVIEAFGKPAEVSAPEKIKEIQRLLGLLSARDGNAVQGKALFAKHCGTCHQLYGEGEPVGPPLDNYDRGNLKFWLPNILDPSLEVREGFQTYLIILHDGRALTGMVAAQDPATITLRTADHQRIVIDRSRIEQLQAIAASLMPEGLLTPLSEEEIKNLFAYLMLGTP